MVFALLYRDKLLSLKPISHMQYISCTVLSKFAVIYQNNDNEDNTCDDTG